MSGFETRIKLTESVIIVTVNVTTQEKTVCVRQYFNILQPKIKYIYNEKKIVGALP